MADYESSNDFLSQDDLDKTSKYNDTLLDILIGSAGKKTRCGAKIETETAIDICRTVSEVFRKEPILLKINTESEFTIVGDLHGNLDDLLGIFAKNGYPPNTNYIFLGDYVDRGSHSIEVIIFLFILKIKFPDSIMLLRGNHESPSMTSSYGFKSDCRRRLSKRAYFNFLSTFQLIPIACILNQRILCVHAGIPSTISDIDEILEHVKPFSIPLEGPVCDLLWSDPVASVDYFAPSDRLVSHFFGSKPLIEFLDNNNLEMLVRSHEQCDLGYNYPFYPQTKRCITIFSASNYCEEGNRSAILRVSEFGDRKLVIFKPPECSNEKRRVILPTWLMEHGEASIPSSDSEKDLPLLFDDILPVTA